MTQSKTKQIDLICKLDPDYVEKIEEMEKMSMLEILNIKMKIKKYLKDKIDDTVCDEDEWSLVRRIGCQY